MSKIGSAVSAVFCDQIPNIKIDNIRENLSEEKNHKIIAASSK
jgi:hypothetical protein